MLHLFLVFLAVPSAPFAGIPQVSSEASPQLLDLAEALAPSYVNDGPGPADEAVSPLLELLLALPKNHPYADADVTFAIERLTPNLKEIHTDRLADGLLKNDFADPNLAAEMLLAAPYSEARVGLARFALAEGLRIPRRADAVGRILAAEGRNGLDRLRPLLHPESNPAILKRIYFYWAGMATADDLPFLEELVLQGPGLCREFALQTWARVETRPEKRLEIFRHSATSGTSYRSVVVRLLATNGSSSDLAEHIKSMLTAPRPENRRLALDVLPYVAGPKAVLEQYHSTSHPSDSLDQQGRWMVRLGRLELPEARQIAADWLLKNGWRHLRYGLAVAKTLAATDALDDVLGSFLSKDGPSLELKLILAGGRMLYSQDAADYLREQLPLATTMHALRICQLLAQSGNPDDLRSLYDFAMNPGNGSMARAEAITQLAQTQQATTYLPRLVSQAQLDFETAEALVGGLVRYGEADLRATGLQLALNGLPNLNGEENRGLAYAAWRAQAANPRVNEAKALISALNDLLSQAAEPFSDGNWPDPRDLSLEFPELVLLAQAAASSSSSELFKHVPQATQQVSSAAVFVCAEAALAAAPSTSLALASQLASRRGLARNARLRTLGLVARAAEACGQTQAQLAALDRIMAVLAKDRSQPTLLELAYGMAFSSPRGWLLPQDQIAQARLIAHAAAQDPEGGRTPALRMLASGGCPTATLIRAIELLLVPTEDDSDYIFPSNAFLAEDLALKAIDMEPENLRARFLLATAFRAEDSPQEAIASLNEVIRLAPAESPYALTAAELKRQLLTDTPQEH